MAVRWRYRWEFDTCLELYFIWLVDIMTVAPVLPVLRVSSAVWLRTPSGPGLSVTL